VQSERPKGAGSQDRLVPCSRFESSEAAGAVLSKGSELFKEQGDQAERLNEILDPRTIAAARDLTVEWNKLKLSFTGTAELLARVTPLGVIRE